MNKSIISKLPGNSPGIGTSIAVIVILFLVSGSFQRGWSRAKFPRADEFRIPEVQDVGTTKTNNPPLYFIPNRGQMNEKAVFCARIPGYTLWLTREGLVFGSRDVSRLVFLDANRNPEVVPEGPTTHRVNYINGSDKSRWYTAIPTSTAVCYPNLYPGIDLKVYGNEKQIEYDWLVKPGGNGKDIGFQYQGVKEVSIDREGNLVVHTASEKWRHQKPVAYQVINGQKVFVDVQFKRDKKGPHTYGFQIGQHNKDYELVIDPRVIAFSSCLGGWEADRIEALAVDSSGAVYVAGSTESSDFPIANAYQATKRSYCDAFVSKLSPDGTSLVFSTFLGGSSFDVVNALALDSSGNLYAAGQTFSSDFPTVNAYQASPGGDNDGFIARFSTDGSTLLYSTYLGGNEYDSLRGIAINSSGEIYVAGDSCSNNFPLANALQTTQTEGDAIVAKLSPSGSSLMFSTYLGGSDMDLAYGLAIDSGGAVYVGGTTRSPDFPTVNAFQSTLAGSGEEHDGFVSKISSNGSSLVYSTYLGGSGFEELFAIAVDGSGAAYVGGFSGSSDYPTTANAYQATRPGDMYDSDAFVTKLSTGGSTLVYSTYLGGPGGWTTVRAIDIDASGSAFITGDTGSPNFPLVEPFQEYLDGWQDTFITQFSADGSQVHFSTYHGGWDYDYGKDIVVDGSGNIYVAGTGDPMVYQGYESPGADMENGFVTKVVSGSTAELTVTAPNGNENWSVGTFQYITWQDDGSVFEVSIDYSTDGGNSWIPIVSNTYNDRYYSWLVPDTPSPNCLVRVQDAYGASSDVSDNVFAITPAGYYIEVYSPNGGEEWAAGNNYGIIWSAGPSIIDVSINYSTDGGSTWIPIAASFPNYGYYSWTIPNSPSSNCLVRVSDLSGMCCDVSNSVFTISPPTFPFITVTSPNGGEACYIGSPYDITWSDSGIVGLISIDYSTNGGYSWNPIAGSIPDTGSYTWTVPATPSNECRVRVRETWGPLSDTSDDEFTISTPMIPLSERNALIALYNSTNGDYWLSRNNWRHPEYPDQFNERGTEPTWSGITCNAEGTHVQEIFLHNNWLNGTLPDLSALTRLERINLSYNQLTANIPPSLNQLTHLTSINFQGNQLTGLIPELGALSQLEELDCSFNQLSGNIPAWLNGLTQLTRIDFQNNQLGGPIPDLSSLIHLNWFNLDNNQVSGEIPTWLNELGSLSHILFSGNQLSGSIPNLSDLSQLDYLALADNQLSGNIPTWLNVMPNLHWLYLSKNQLTGTIPDLSGLTGIMDFSVDHNQLSGSIPAEIGNLTSLYYLRLHGNQLTGSLPTTLANLSHLSNNFGLDITYNGLYTDDPGLRDFLNSRQKGGDWESTQTVAPADVWVDQVTNHSVKIAWTAIAYQGNAGGYRIYYTTTPGSGYMLDGTTADKSADDHTVQNLSASTTYYFVVQTFTEPHGDNPNTVTSEYSMEISATTLAE
jgi:Leucine-rich repeat (LRR) protein